MTDRPTPDLPRDAPPEWDVIARHVSGESSDDEARAMDAWLARHPADAELLAALDVAVGGVPAFASSSAAGGTVDVEAALRRVQAHRDRPTSARLDVVPFRTPVAATRAAVSRRWWVAPGVAAAAAIAAVSVSLGRDARRPNADAGRDVQTAVGVRDSLVLGDGTRIVLAPGSRVTVSGDYGVRTREVLLDGEAWFVVRHDATRPFVVRAAGAVVRDLGTRFTVRAVAGPGSRVAVAVLEGSVAIAARAGGDSLVLRAGDRGAVQADGRLDARRGAARADDASWTQGRLVYRDAPLSDVQADVARWYGVELRIADSSLAGRRLTATFDGDPVERVLAVIGLAVGGAVTRTGATATLTPTPRTPQ